jgi:hypothetical protein
VAQGILIVPASKVIDDLRAEDDEIGNRLASSSEELRHSVWNPYLDIHSKLPRRNFSNAAKTMIDNRLIVKLGAQHTATLFYDTRPTPS